MSSYVCPECGMGFPERQGRVKVSQDIEFDSVWVKIFAWCIVLSGGGSWKRTEIHCPDCEYILIGEEEQ